MTDHPPAPSNRIIVPAFLGAGLLQATIVLIAQLAGAFPLEAEEAGSPALWLPLRGFVGADPGRGALAATMVLALAWPLEHRLRWAGSVATLGVGGLAAGLTYALLGERMAGSSSLGALPGGPMAFLGATAAGILIARRPGRNHEKGSPDGMGWLGEWAIFGACGLAWLLVTWRTPQGARSVEVIAGVVSALCGALILFALNLYEDLRAPEGLPPRADKDPLAGPPTSRTAPKGLAALTPFQPSVVGLLSEESAALIGAIEAGDGRRAYRLYRRHVAARPEASLAEEYHWRLVRLLMEEGYEEATVDLLKRYLARHPHGRWSTQARFELGLLYAEEAEMRGPAMIYIKEALEAGDAPGPEAFPGTLPEPLEPAQRRRARRALERLSLADLPEGLRAASPAAEPLDTVFDPPDAEEPTPQVKLNEAFSSLGESPDDVGSQPAAAEAASSPAADATDATDTEGFERLGLRGAAPSERDAPDVFGAEIGSKAELPPSIETSDPGSSGNLARTQVQELEDLTPISLEDSPPEPADTAGGATPAGLPAREEGGRPASPVKPSEAGEQSHPPIRLEPLKTEERPEPPWAGARTETAAPEVKPVRLGAAPPPLAFGLSTEDRRRTGREPFDPAQSDAEETETWLRQYARDRRPRYWEEHRYSVILAPARAVAVEAVVGVMSEWLTMSREGVLHGLRRHHGLLATDLSRAEGIELAERLVRAGQDVLLIEHDERLAFGPPLDAWRVELGARRATFWTEGRTLRRKWAGLIALSGGRVKLHPEAPERDVIDLFYTGPGLHLRLWRGTLQIDLGEGSGPVEATHGFRRLAEELALLAPSAIRSRAFTQWLRGGEERPSARFVSLIEYDHYAGWYLMAHYGRYKLMEAPATAGAKAPG